MQKEPSPELEVELSNPFATPKKRGERLKRLRNLANLTRIQLCSDGDISVHTLSGWENGRFGGLTYAGANRVIKRVAKEGVKSSVEWLLEEIGTGPTIVSDYVKGINDVQVSSLDNPDEAEEEKHIMSELALFKQHHKNSAEFIVDDDTMSPQYYSGDYVAGRKRYTDDIKTVIGLTCIVQTTEGKVFLRTVMPGESEESYHLICSNPNTERKNALIYNVKLISAAPVIWHRRKDLK